MHSVCSICDMILWIVPQVAEPQVSSLCKEAQECMIGGRWLDLASLMLTSADLVFPKASEKGYFQSGA